MGRHAVWPPRITTCKSTGRDRCRYRGKTYNLGRAGSAEARSAYVELVRRLEGERDEGELVAGPDGHDGTVAGLVALWYLECLERYGASNQEVVEHVAAMRPVLRLYASLKVKEFDALSLERVRDEMVRSKLCRNVVNRRVTRIRTAWRWAERRRIAPAGSWSALRALEPLSAARRDVRKTERVRPANPDHVAAVLAVAPAGLANLIRLLGLTGARPSELFTLRVGMIERSGAVWCAHLQNHKCAWRGLSRTLHFGPKAQEILTPLLIDRPPAAPVLLHSKGWAWNRRSADVALRRACLVAGVPKFSAYQLRHLWAIQARLATSIDHARAGMGHADVSTTMSYGANAGDASLAAEVARRLG